MALWFAELTKRWTRVPVPNKDAGSFFCALLLTEHEQHAPGQRFCEFATSDPLSGFLPTMPNFYLHPWGALLVERTPHSNDAPHAHKVRQLQTEAFLRAVKYGCHVGLSLFLRFGNLHRHRLAAPT